MPGKRPKPEEIVSKLRQVEVLQGQGMPIADAVRQIGVTQQTYYRWRKLYGGMGREQLETSGARDHRHPKTGVRGLRHLGAPATAAFLKRPAKCYIGAGCVDGDRSLELAAVCEMDR